LGCYDLSLPGYDPCLLLIVAIQMKLRQCPECQWSECEILHDTSILEEILEAADERISFDEIWKIPSLFAYNETLAPWFFGMNLVRFEYTGQGRSLEIIGS
jgi:hypothetical protein